jgi:ubiquinone/menaquinone biosynthesis C-methylase UbiE
MNKVSRISLILDSRNYPTIFYRFSILVRFTYIINFVLTLRNWYVHRVLRKLEKRQLEGFSFLDAGCGMGEFAIGMAKRNPNSKVSGIDFVASNESISSHVARSMHLTNIKFLNGDLTKLNVTDKYDLILCNSTLQFIKEDENALNNIKTVMKKTGVLILYVPIIYRRYLPWSEHLENKYLSDFFYKYHDDFLMHKYQAEEMLQKLHRIGFTIKHKEYAYGIFGAIGFELYSLILAAVMRFHFLISIPCILIYFCTLFPVQIIMMLADYIIPKSSGNGLLIVAEKKL